MVPSLRGGETVLTGLLKDRSALFGVLAQIEALDLELLEVRQLRPNRRTHEQPRKSPDPGDGGSPDHSRRFVRWAPPGADP
jgi:hypothetical protein